MLARKQKRLRKRMTQVGMTLVEVMVAVAIFAMVTVIVFGGLSQTVRNKEALELTTDHSHTIRMTLERMVRELASAYVSVHVNPNAQLTTMRTVFHGRSEGRGSRLDFTSFSHRRLYRDAHESDQCELGYYMTRHPEVSNRRVLVRREQRRPDGEPEEGGEARIALEDVSQFELEYLDGTSYQWVESWDTNGTEQNRLPAQVRIRLTVPAVTDRTREEVYVTRANVPITHALNFSVYL